MSEECVSYSSSHNSSSHYLIHSSSHYSSSLRLIYSLINAARSARSGWEAWRKRETSMRASMASESASSPAWNTNTLIYPVSGCPLSTAQRVAQHPGGQRAHKAGHRVGHAPRADEQPDARSGHIHHQRQIGDGGEPGAQPEQHNAAVKDAAQPNQPAAGDQQKAANGPCRAQARDVFLAQVRLPGRRRAAASPARTRPRWR